MIGMRRVTKRIIRIRLTECIVLFLSKQRYTYVKVNAVARHGNQF